MSQLEGDRAPKTRRDGRLEIDHPVTKKMLTALSLAGCELADFRTFSNRLARDADAWLRRVEMHSPNRRLSRRDAENHWRQLFGKRSINALGRYAQGGGL